MIADSFYSDVNNNRKDNIYLRSWVGCSFKGDESFEAATLDTGRVFLDPEFSSLSKEDVMDLNELFTPNDVKLKATLNWCHVNGVMPSPDLIKNPLEKLKETDLIRVNSRLLMPYGPLTKLYFVMAKNNASQLIFNVHFE